MVLSEFAVFLGDFSSCFAPLREHCPVKSISRKGAKADERRKEEI